MAINGHTMAIYELNFFFPFSYKIAKNWKQRKKFSFHLIQIFKSWASQNDHQILSFVKGINVVGKKLPETV